MTASSDDTYILVNPGWYVRIINVPVVVVVSLTRSLMIKAIRASYEILIIAFEVSAVGNCIVNVPFEAVKSPPNANTQTALVVPDPPAVVVL